MVEWFRVGRVYVAVRAAVVNGEGLEKIAVLGFARLRYLVLWKGFHVLVKGNEESSVCSQLVWVMVCLTIQWVLGEG